MHFSKRNIYTLGLLFTDTIVVYWAFKAAYSVRFFNTYFLFLFPLHKGFAAWSIYKDLLNILVPLWIGTFIFWGRIYQQRFANFFDESIAIFKSTLLASAFTILGSFLYRGYEYSRIVMMLGSSLSFVLILLSHQSWKFLLHHFLESWTRRSTTLLAGDGKSLQRLKELLGNDQHRQTRFYGLKQGPDILNQLDCDPQIDELILSASALKHNEDSELWEKILDQCEDKNIAVKVLPDILDQRMGEVVVDESIGIPLLHLKPLSLHGTQYLFKRIFDVSLCVVLLFFLAIPFGLIALLICLDSPGGAFFVQERVGFKERRFNCVKFRTMRQDAEKVLEDMNLPSFRGGPAFKMKGDPRITRAGKILRKFSLDEFPQIWNILLGQMSFIGPRPQVLKEAAGNPPWAKKRFRVLPGITGLWQVSGRADLSYEEMMRLDVYYMENWSLGLDLKILLKTIPVVVGSKGAY